MSRRGVSRSLGTPRGTGRVGFVTWRDAGYFAGAELH